MSFTEAGPILKAMPAGTPVALKTLTPEAWEQWVRVRDRQIRSRIAQGEELTVSNLLRLGVTYTNEPRITYDVLTRYGQDRAVNGLAERRAGDLIRAQIGRAHV